MTEGAYYNEIDPYCCEWLELLMFMGLIPEGRVDSRPVQKVKPEEIKGYAQVHLFAGMGGWPCALRMAGWPDERGIWTGSCPCQPFSVAGKGGGQRIDGIYGPTCIDSFVEDGPLLSWENRLRERLGMLGSTEWELTWRRKGTRGGRWISRLAASMPRTSGTGCTGLREMAGYPTPRESDGKKNVRTVERALAEIRRKGGPQDLIQAVLAGYPTPNATDGDKAPKFFARGNPSLPYMAKNLIAGYPTPTARDHKNGQASPATHDRNSRPLNEVTTGMITTLSGQTGTASIGVLNPAFVLWLMGYDPEWLNSAP